MRIALRPVVAFVFGLSVASFGGCEACAPPAVVPDPDERRCVRTEALDEARACVADDDCACGAHCSFNSCAFDCRDNAGCDGADVCDDFGRCSPAGQGVPPVQAVSRANLFASSTAVGVSESDTPYFVRVFPRAGATGPLRMVARGGALLWCPGAEQPAAACDVEGIGAAGTTIGIGLPLVAALPVNGLVEAPTVDVSDESGRLTSVAAFQVASQAPVVLDGPSMSGLYTGSARRGAGGGLLSPIAVPGAETVAANLRHAVTATLSLNDALTGVLKIDDATGLVLPNGSVVVAVTAGTVRWPALTWLALADSQVEVITRAVDVTLVAPDGTFSLDVPLATAGLALDGTQSPSLGTLTFNFTRTEALPANFIPPAPTAAAVARLDVDRGLDALAPGAIYDALAVLADPDPLTVGEVLSGPWNRPRTCVAGADPTAILADRLAAIPASCEAARAETCAVGTGSFCPLPITSPNACTAGSADVVASGGTAGLRFGCDYTLTVPTQFCASLQPDVRQGRWSTCLEAEVGPAPTCTADDGISTTGPATTCSTGQCQDGVCTRFTLNQVVNFCLSRSCVPQNGAPPTEEIRIDRCDEARAATGCELVDVNVFEEATAADLRLDNGFDDLFQISDDPEAGFGLLLAFSKRTTRECVVPAYAPDRDCTIGALCTPTPRTTDPTTFGADADVVTGDPLCENDTLPGALTAFTTSLDQNAELPDLARCADALPALVELASRTATIPEAELNDDTGCFAAARLVAAVDMAARGPRSGRAPEPVSLGLAHRLVQEVVEVQALVARNALDVYRQRITFDGDDTPTDLDADLEKSQAAWGFVLDPRVSGVLLAMPGAVLRQPDPRPGVGIVPNPNASEGIAQGVSVSLLEALSDQLAAQDFALERAWLDGQANAIGARRATIAATLRTGSVVVALADALHVAAAADGVVPWEKGYQNARLNYALLVRRLLERAEAIDSGLNPLGIEDIDTPIFFPGDVEGDRARFTAVSSNLVGTGPGDLEALAAIAIREAQQALAIARLDWRENASGVADSQRRQDDLIRRYGELVTGYCGAPINDPDFDIGTYNVLDEPLDVETCFVEPACRPAGFQEVLTAADLGFGICMATRIGLAVGESDDPALAATLNALRTPFSKASIGTGAFPLSIVRLDEDLNRQTAVIRLTGSNTDVSIPLNALGQIGAPISPALLGAAAAQALVTIANDCRATQQRTIALRPKVSPASCSLADSCAFGDKCAAGACVTAVQDDFLDKVECYYDGAISEQAIAVRSAALEVEVARAELNEYTERFNIAGTSCTRLGEGATAQERLLADHNDTMNDLNIARTVAASVSSAAENARECAAAGVGLDATTPITLGATGTAVAAACAAAAVSAAADIAVEALDNVMAGAERKHAAAVLAAQNITDQKICLNDASLELVGAKAQTLRIKQAVQAQSAAIINLRGQKSYTAGLWADGNAALEKERRIAEAAALGRFVLSDAAELYIDRFRYAQRLTYLAVRAVEYEFQRQESQNRDDVIGAANPNELEAVLRNLAATVNNGTVDGSQPTGLLAVVSLREHVLQIPDLSRSRTGEQTLTSQQRFQLLLTSPQFAVVDDDGTYLGQQLPFSLAPLGALGLGNTAGIPIVAQSDCAERLWAVNAAVIGGTDLFDGESSSFTRIDLLQQNTFASQACDDSDGPLLVSTTRPAINLLADYANFAQRERNPLATATAQFARGGMQPYLNVSREEFEREDFSQGSTDQLAGRGLYGDYALFIPAAALSVDGGPGLKLDAVDDILLRFDYVAAAR